VHRYLLSEVSKDILTSMIKCVRWLLCEKVVQDEYRLASFEILRQRPSGVTEEEEGFSSCRVEIAAPRGIALRRLRISILPFLDY